MLLDLGCGRHKLEGYTGMDSVALDGVDIVHDIENLPWPIESGSVTHCNASHVMEHIKPWKILEVMNELWRVMAPKAEADFRTPYGDYYRFDPTHCIHWMAPTWLYFDHTSFYYGVYEPKPWKMMKAEDNEQNMELHVIMRKVTEK